jgi:hypothetical protein
MLDPMARRTAQPGTGLAIPLADGQLWIVPPPGEMADRQLGPDYPLVLSALAEADSPAERLRTELALAILLLDATYSLTPGELEHLLLFPPGSPALLTFQAAVAAVAADHLAAHRSSPPVAEAPARPASLSTWLRRVLNQIARLSPRPARSPEPNSQAPI